MKEVTEYGMERFKVAMELCEIQRRSGLFFIFERPSSASRWIASSVQRTLNHFDVKVREGDECQFGMQAVERSEPNS